MATIGGKMPSREAALALIAQVERQAGVIARRYGGDDRIMDHFAAFRTFVDQLAEFHLFVDMVENRLGTFEPESRAAQVRKLSTIRWAALEMELEVSSRFLDRMATGGKPWPMGSQKFLRRRLTRLDDIAGFHAAHGAAYDMAPPSLGLMQNIRDRVAAQIDNSVPLADFGAAEPPPMPAAEAVPERAPAVGMPAEEVPRPPTIAEPVAPAVAPRSSPLAPPPPVPTRSEPAHIPQPQPVVASAAPPLPEVMIPGMMSFTPPPVAKSSASAAPAAEAADTKAAMPRPQAVAPLPPDLLVPALPISEPPGSSAPASEVLASDDAADWDFPLPDPPAQRPAAPVSPEPADFDAEYVSRKAKAVAKLAGKPAGKEAPKPGLARRDFRLKVRDDADGYHYIEGNGLAVITEACRVANTTIDELARNLELSRPGLVLILNGRDPASTELLKTLRRFVMRTGGLA